MEPVLSVKPNRFIYLLLALIALALAILFIICVVDPGFFAETREVDAGGQPSLMPRIIFGFFILIGLFLTFVWIRMFIKDEPTIVIYQNGFEANTNGISTGFVAWNDIERIEEVTVKRGNGSTKEPTLAVYLKKPELYTRRLPLFLQWVMKLAEKSGRYRHEGKYGVMEDTVPVFLPVASFGAQYEMAKQLLFEGLHQTKGHK